jgi:mevalonate kinase
MKKFTTLDSDIIKENAELTQKFESVYNEAIDKLDSIKQGLETMKMELAKDPKNWGFFGSAEHINEELDDIIEFMGRYAPSKSDIQ